MNRIVLVAATAYAGICVGAARADDCSEATIAKQDFRKRSERALSQARTTADRIKCCTAAYFQASCDYHKLALEQDRLSQQAVVKEAKACKVSAEQIARLEEQGQTLIKQTQTQLDDDCATAERYRKEETKR